MRIFRRSTEAEERAIIDALTQQTIWAQSFVFRLLKERCGLEEKDADLMEVTYFALSIATASIFLSKIKQKEHIADGVVQNVLQLSLGYGAMEYFSTSLQHFRHRKREYDSLFDALFSTSQSSSDAPEVTVLMHVWECVSRRSASTQMLNLYGLAALPSGLIEDYLDLIRKTV